MTHARVTKDSSLENKASKSHCECAEERCSTSWNFINVGLAKPNNHKTPCARGRKSQVGIRLGRSQERSHRGMRSEGVLRSANHHMPSRAPQIKSSCLVKMKDDAGKPPQIPSGLSIHRVLSMPRLGKMFSNLCASLGKKAWQPSKGRNPKLHYKDASDA